MLTVQSALLGAAQISTIVTITSPVKRSIHAREGFASIKVLSSGIAFGVLAVLAMSAGTATAQIGNGKPQCAIGLKFEPGPIVNGHQRQPTQREFEARMQLLQEQARLGNMQGCDPLP